MGVEAMPIGLLFLCGVDVGLASPPATVLLVTAAHEEMLTSSSDTDADADADVDPAPLDAAAARRVVTVIPPTEWILTCIIAFSFYMGERGMHNTMAAGPLSSLTAARRVCVGRTITYRKWERGGDKIGGCFCGNENTEESLLKESIRFLLPVPAGALPFLTPSSFRQWRMPPRPNAVAQRSRLEISRLVGAISRRGKSQWGWNGC